MNKGVSGLVPLVAGGAYAHIWKAKPTDISKHQKAVGAVVALAAITNIWSLMTKSKIPDMEDRLMEKYVWTLDDDVLDSYAKGARFPNAK